MGKRDILIRPSDAPNDGEDVYVNGGPADGRITQMTGMRLIYKDEPVLGRLIGSLVQHHYLLVEKQHVVTGEKMWVYEFQGSD